MSKYFSKYPKIIYNNQVVTNILTRVKLDYSKNSSMFYDYTVKEGETPEIIAFNKFGDAEKHWVILVINNFMDPQFSFPLTNSQFNSYLNKKYKNFGGVAYTQGTLNPEPFRYRKIITIKDLSLNTLPVIEKYYIDQATYANTGFFTSSTKDGLIQYSEDKEAITIYDYELEKNEKNRIIKLVRPELVSMIQQQFERLMDR